MDQSAFIVRSKVTRFPGHGGWHFLWVDRQQSKTIKKLFGHLRRGWDSLPVTVTLGSSVWKTSIFYSAKDAKYLLGLKAEVRKKEDVKMGDRVRFAIQIREI